MPRTDGTNYAGQRKVDTISRADSLLRSGLNRSTTRFDLRFELRLEFIELLADRRLQFFGSWFQPVVTDESEHTGFTAKPLHAEFFERIDGVHGLQIRSRLRQQLREK